MKNTIKSIATNKFILSLDTSVGGTYLVKTERQGKVTVIELEDLKLALVLFDDTLVKLEGN